MTAVVLHADVSGLPEGPAIVFLGSLGSSIDMWEPQAEALTGQFRVIRLDLRGHGRSAAPGGAYSLDELVDDVVLTLDQLGLPHVHVVGLSLGGMVAMRLTARHPDRVQRLALLCTSAYLPPAQAWRERAALVMAQGTIAVADAVVSRWLTTDGARRGPERVTALREMVAGTPAAGYAGCCHAIAEMDLREDLAGITSPTLLIAGAQDPATPPDHLQAIEHALRDAQLLVLRDAAHLANVEQPAAVNAALQLHFSQHDTTDGDRYQRGRQVRRAVLGDAHVDRAVEGTTAFTAGFQDFITRAAWGDIWSRAGLSRRERSIATLAALTALSHDEELAMHVRAGLRNGLSRDEIGEVLLHTGIYAGVPAANRAFKHAANVFAESADDDQQPEHQPEES